jgi:hypothetical protein
MNPQPAAHQAARSKTGLAAGMKRIAAPNHCAICVWSHVLHPLTGSTNSCGGRECCISALHMD